MKMGRLEKLFVNRSSKGRWNVRRLEEQLARIPRECVRDVLELGCGRGDAAAWLAERYPVSVTGLDFDPAQVELARRVHPEGARQRFVTGDAAHLGFTDASFDLIVSQNVFHHVPNWPQAAHEVARVLRPGGLRAVAGSGRPR